MNDKQPGTPTANSYFDASLFLHDCSHVIPDTLANAIPETTPDVVELLAEQDTVALPVLRLPQVAPSQVIATRQRSLTPVPNVQSRVVMHPRSPMVKRQRPVQPASTKSLHEAPSVQLTPRPYGIDNTPVTPLPDNPLYQKVSKLHGITYIPRSMTRQEPTVVDALIACGTLILMCVCVILFLYYIGL